MNIPFFNYPELYKQHREDLLRVFDDTASKGAYILQDELKAFEEKIATYTSNKYCLGVGNATDALELLLLASGLKDGDEVIVSSHTMIATASAIKFTGATPVPADIGPDGMMDPSSIENLITKNTRAIMPTQLNGRICHMDPIQEIANRYNLDIYEDSAQALGAKYKGKHIGSFGKGGCISFYPAKILGCLGDGGAVLCNDEEIYKKIRLMRDHGRDEDGSIKLWGFNSRLDNIQAAILIYYFQSYEETIKRRRDIAKIYNENLENINQVRLPPAPDDSGDHYDVFQNYEIQANDRDKLKDFLQKNGIGTLIQWGGIALHHLGELNMKKELPQTDAIFNNLLMLPINLSIKDEDVGYICSKIIEFYDQ